MELNKVGVRGEMADHFRPHVHKITSAIGCHIDRAMYEVIEKYCLINNFDDTQYLVHGFCNFNYNSNFL